MQRSFQPGPRVTIILPFPLPTWNVIIRQKLRDRMKLTKFIRDFVSRSIIEAGGSQTPPGAVIRPQLTASLEAEYYAMIRPPTLRKSPKRLASGKTKKQS
jgi:hypothetical protein